MQTDKHDEVNRRIFVNYRCKSAISQRNDGFGTNYVSGSKAEDVSVKVPFCYLDVKIRIHSLCGIKDEMAIYCLGFP